MQNKITDNFFKTREITCDDLYISGLYPVTFTNAEIFIKKEESDKKSIVLMLSHGNAYEIKFSSKPVSLRSALCDADPRELKNGNCMSASLQKGIPCYSDEVPGESADFLCVPRLKDQYLVIYMGDGEPPEVTVYEHPILLGHDTDDCWLECPDVGDVLGNEDSWGDYRWSSDELYEHVYEPMRLKYPEYISRTWIGYDETNTYDTWAYIFEPQGYEQTLFLTAGIHGDEIDAYLGLARFLELMCETADTSDNEGLKYLRHKVRLVVIPLVNVWSSHLENNIRHNSNKVDLNRDFEAHTQAETINVIWLLHRYKDDIAALLDFHNSPAMYPGLFYQFSIQATNSEVCRKVANHIQERIKANGWEEDPGDLQLLPGVYNKSSKYLQGYVYNRFGIPTLVAEHNLDRWYPIHSAENLRFAVECFGNLIIQTALAKLK